MAKKKKIEDKDKVIDEHFNDIRKAVEFKSLDNPEVQAEVKTILSKIYDMEPE